MPRSDERRPILYPPARAMLIDVLFALISDDRRQLGFLIRDLSELVPFDNDDDGMSFYGYLKRKAMADTLDRRLLCL
jgi:hypothetical protein